MAAVLYWHWVILGNSPDDEVNQRRYRKTASQHCAIEILKPAVKPVLDGKAARFVSEYSRRFGAAGSTINACPDLKLAGFRPETGKRETSFVA